MSEQAWITEAKKHIGTREIPGARHEPKILQWWKAIKRGGIKSDEVPWCFTGETEILSEHGWIRLDELGAQQVYQADEAGAITLTPCVKIRKDYSGDVFDVAHRSVRLTCDIGHRWWGRWGKAKHPTFGTLDGLTVDGLSVPAVHSSAKGCALSDNELTLLAAFISDGKFRYSKGSLLPRDIEFEVSRQRKINELRRLSPDHEYTQARAYGPLTKTPLTVFRFKIPGWLSACMCDYKSLAPSFISSLSKEQAQVFLRAYAKFDGNDTDSSTILYTSSERMVGDLLWITVMAGFHASVQHRPDAGGLGEKPAYALQYCANKKNRHIRQKHVTRRQFDGILYCVQVPQGRIVVRGPGSAPVVVGNCAAFVGGCLEAVGIVSSRFESAKSYMTWGKSIPSPLPGCIVVFSRTGGGHVAFVIGQNKAGHLVCIGGNQGNAVTVAAFDRARVIGYRWPVAVPLPKSTVMPSMEVAGALSRDEA